MLMHETCESVSNVSTLNKSVTKWSDFKVPSYITALKVGREVAELQRSYVNYGVNYSPAGQLNEREPNIVLRITQTEIRR